MDLVWNVPEFVKYGQGQVSFMIPAGKTLKVETSPHGEEILSIEVPAGKIWTVNLSIFAEEDDQ